MAKELFKVAVATSDGINVDSHFGHVAEFVIYEVDSKTGEGEPIEERGIDKYGCQDGTCGGEVFDEIAEILAEAGIEFVLAAKIGPRALQALTRQNIIALDVVVPVNEALHKVRDYRDRRKLAQERARKILIENGIEE